MSAPDGKVTPRVGRPRANPRDDDGLDAREQILDAAAALFAEHGYAGTSTRAIAERVGIRQASLYYHVAGKDDLLLELLERSVRPSLDFVADLLRLGAGERRYAALHALAVIDVGTLLATPHNIGTLYLTHEVQQPRFEPFHRHRAELRSAYVELAGSEFAGSCCLQLVEMVIGLRRDREPAPAESAGLREEIATACLRVVGLAPGRVAAAAREGARLVEQLAGEGSRTPPA
ncbi:TetR/AcrR family transcriptional regulator [Nocardioides mangrovicus]|uniref:TetR/AcrR family transcriptional regulator n=1 Tax=Nocardioides mangrovicus TaxID=2478913 RepID=UPI001E2F089D|nr:TetR/AcrR family transcriptional regulator [Nocardioides mangrovicus]